MERDLVVLLNSIPENWQWSLDQPFPEFRSKKGKKGRYRHQFYIGNGEAFATEKYVSLS